MGQLNALRHMALFVEVARRRSFSGAARALDVPVSSLSRWIAAFEAEIGVRLLDRTTRRTALTTQGEAYYRHCLEIVDAARQAYDEIMAQARGPVGRLRVAASLDLAIHSLPPLVAAFMDAHAGIDVHLEPATEPSRPSEAAPDVVIAIGAPAADSWLIARLLTTIPMGLYAAPRYLAARLSPQRPDELAAHVCLRASDHAAWTLRHGDEVAIVPVRGHTSSSALSVIGRLTSQGLGIAQLPDMLARDAGLVRVLPGWSGEPLAVYALTASRLLPARTRAFIDFLAVHLPAALMSERPGTRAAPDLLEADAA